jgi:hypothetical protein
MSETPLGKTTSENAAEGPPQEVLDKIVLLLVSGLARSAIDEAVGKLGLSGDAASSAIAEARMRIAIAARWDRNDQLGTALVRLNDIYRRSLASQDAKTALAVQKELNRLLDLYRAAAPSPQAVGDRPSPNASATVEMAAARAHLTPLGLGNERTSLAELCRLAVLRIIKDGERSISQAPRADGRDPEGSGPRRTRHRANPAD